MFTSQVDLIKKLLIENNISLADIEKHNIHIGTANTSQGNEWDVVLISWVIDNKNSKYQSLTFACNPERLNVITSRGREKVVNYYSKDNISSDCLLGRYLGIIESENKDEN